MKRLLFVTLALSVWPVHLFAQNNVAPPLITVTGRAEIRVPPDEVLFTMKVENVDKDMLVANKRTDDVVKQVLAIARKHKVGPEDIQTSYMSLEPKFNTDYLDDESRRKTKRVLIGYEVSKTIVVRLREIDRFDDLLAEVMKAGITELRSLEFRDSQIRKHKDQARVQAIRAAREKAELLAKEINQSIGPAYSIEESDQNYARSSNANFSNLISSDMSQSESAFAPGSISITAQVTVSFRLMQ